MTLWFRFNFKKVFLIILFGFILICGVVLYGIQLYANLLAFVTSGVWHGTGVKFFISEYFNIYDG